MNIHIQARGFALTDSLREHVERRLRFALGWADDRLRQVSVRLSGRERPARGRGQALPNPDHLSRRPERGDRRHRSRSVRRHRPGRRPGRPFGGASAGAAARRSPGFITRRAADSVTLSLH